MDEEQLAKAIGWAGLFLRWSPYAGKTSGAAHAMALDADVDDRGGLIGVLIFYSCEERWAWDAPSAMTQAALRNRSGPLSYQHANWAADMLAGKGLKPKAGGKRLAHRDLAVAEAIVLLGKNRGLKPTRSRSDLPNCCAEGGSACDAVGVASRMNYKVIESIWTQWDDDASERLQDKSVGQFRFDWISRPRQFWPESEIKWDALVWQSQHTPRRSTRSGS